MKRFIFLVVAWTLMASILPGTFPARASERLTWRDCISPQQLISAGNYHTVAIKEDGTVVAVGKNDTQWYSPAQCDVGAWTDIVAVSAGYYKTIGLKRDGTVVYAGIQDYGQGDADKWTDIVAVSAGGNHCVGLKRDGTVVACGSNNGGQCSVGEWRDIVAISAGEGYTLGLRADGTVVATGYEERDRGTSRMDVGGWTAIRAITAGRVYSAGIREDGTAVSAGKNYYGDPMPVDGWRDLAAVASCDNYVLGLSRDGAVINVKDNRWAGMIAIDRDADGNHTVGLRKDGTAFADGDNSYGQCDVSGWQNLMTVPRGPDFADEPYGEASDIQEPTHINADPEGIPWAEASPDALEGTWTGVYRFTGALNLEKADVSQEARDRFLSIIGQDKFFQMSIKDGVIVITAESISGTVGQMGALQFTLLEGASFSINAPVTDGHVNLSGIVYKLDGQMEIRGEYLVTGPMPGGVDVTFTTEYSVIRDDK